MPHFVFVYADHVLEWNTSQWLCKIPCQVLPRGGITSDLMKNSDFSLFNKKLEVRERLEAADMVVVERTAVSNSLRAIRKWREYGHPLTFRFDDHYRAMPDYMPSYPWWKKNITSGFMDGEGHAVDVESPRPVLEMFDEAISLATYVSCPSRYLLETYVKDATKRRFIPNRHDHRHWMWTEGGLPHVVGGAMYEHPGELWIGWGGSVGHLESWRDSGIIPALAKIFRKYPQCRLALVGDNPHIRKELVMGGVPVGVIRPLPKVDHETWPRVVKSFDIGVAPLAGEYDRGRSWIKCLEYAQCGIPYIGSDHGNVYEEVEGAILVKTGEGWFSAIEDVIDNPDGAFSLAAKQWAESQSLEHHIAEYGELV